MTAARGRAARSLGPGCHAPRRRWRIAALAVLASVFVALPVLAGPVIVRTQPAVSGAFVRVDGTDYGQTASDGSVLITGLQPGEHLIALFLPDGRAFTRTQTVTSDALAAQVVFAVPPAPPPSAGGGKALLLVSGNVGNALVEVNGVEVGRAGPADGSLLDETSPGSHRIRLSAEGYEPQERTVTASAGPAVRVAFELSRARAGASPASATTPNQTVTVLLALTLAVAVGVIAAIAFSLARQPRKQRVTTRRIDRYEVHELIGRGGMATVYKATDTVRRNAPPVALKVMEASHLSDPDLVHKFLREGEILQQLNRTDPDAPLVQIFHYGRAGNDGGRPFIAMEFIEGEDLLRYLRRHGKLSLRSAARVVAGVARALVPAHAAGVYHRDLTPDNVILTRSPRGGYPLRLIDFGVARHEYTSHGTLDGSIAGKPPYMSPEQCQGVPVDGRSDVYALGIMLFTLLIGTPPFVSKNPLEVMRMHKEDEVAFPADLPAAAKPVLERALAKDRDRRHGSIGEFLTDVQVLERMP